MSSRFDTSIRSLTLFLLLLAGGGVCADNAHTVAPSSAFKDFDNDEDPISFVQTVNRSMAKDEDKLDDRRIKTLYRVNRDVVRAAREEDFKNVLAEVFATAPVKCLPYFTDTFAKEVFARSARKYGPKEESFVEFACAALMRVSQRCRRADNLPAFRSVFAVIMFLKASEGKPDDLRESFMIYIHSGLHEIARDEWLPAVFGDNGDAPTYRPMMEAGYRQEPPDHRIQVGAADPPELLNLHVHSDHAVEHDAWDVQSPRPVEPWRVQPGGETLGAGIWRVPRAGDSGTKRGHKPHNDDPSCPCPYMGQTL